MRQDSEPYPPTMSEDYQWDSHVCPCTHLLFFGWYPQKEMFFSWKKWLHLFPYRSEGRSKMVNLQGEAGRRDKCSVCGGRHTRRGEAHASGKK